MDIQYLGHSCFKLKGKKASVVIDPYSKQVGWSMPSVSADVVLVTHEHEDHSNVGAVSGTARRKSPFVIREVGEYEVEGVSVFGYQTFHDGSEGSERGENVVYRVQVDYVTVLHLGDLGHLLDKKFIEKLGNIDVVMVPVGGVYTIGPADAWKLASEIGAEIVLPMHYKTDKHNSEVFGGLSGLDDFKKAYGGDIKVVENKLSVSRLSLGGESVEVVQIVSR